MTVRQIYIRWADTAKAKELVAARGGAKDDHILDWIEADECFMARKFDTMKAARSWAIHHRRLDLFGAPDLIVEEWPDKRRRSWECERVLHQRYIGDGLGWETINLD